MNFSPHVGEEISQFKSDVMLREKNSEEPFTDKLRFIYLNLPYFTKKAEECVTDFEKWIYVLKHMTTLERIPFETQKKIFKRLAEVADSRCLSKEEMEKYEESHAFGEIYETILKEMQSAGSSGEFYTPRALTGIMAEIQRILGIEVNVDEL